MKRAWILTAMGCWWMLWGSTGVLQATAPPSRPSATRMEKTTSPAAAPAPLQAPSQPTGGTPAAGKPEPVPPVELPPDFLTKADQPEAAADNQFNLVTRTSGSLVLVLGLVVGAAWLVRRLAPHRFGATTGPPLVEVLKTVSLGDRRTLTVVRFGDRTLLLGSTPTSVTVLASDIVPEEPEFTLPEPGFALGSVAEVLNRPEIAGTE